jgi:hypothetical protein
MAPEAFAYYVPSLLVGTILDPDFRDMAFDGILPHNQRRAPRGEWWTRFAATFTDPQRAAVRAFLTFEKRAVGFTFDLVDEELVGIAENLWA